MAHSELQKLQKARAYFKFVITGLFKPVNYSFLTSAEADMWKEILELRKNLILIHDENSRNLGLNVPIHRCHVEKCREEAVQRIDIGHFCEKHYKQIIEEDDTK